MAEALQLASKVEALEAAQYMKPFNNSSRSYQ
jgi:hypothetical protein